MKTTPAEVTSSVISPESMPADSFSLVRYFGNGQKKLKPQMNTDEQLGETNFTDYHELILLDLNSCKLVQFVSVFL
jgi:hypothetical protein